MLAKIGTPNQMLLAQDQVLFLIYIYIEIYRIYVQYREH